MTQITISYQLSEAEYMEACEAHWRSLGQGTRSNSMLAVTAIVIGAVLIPILYWISVVVVFVAMCLLLMMRIRSRLWRNAYKESGRFNGAITITFDDKDVDVELENARSTLSWDYYDHYKDTDKYVLLYVSKKQFSIIPKRAFGEEPGVEEFIALLDSKLKQH